VLIDPKSTRGGGFAFSGTQQNVFPVPSGRGPSQFLYLGLRKQTFAEEEPNKFEGVALLGNFTAEAETGVCRSNRIRSLSERAANFPRPGTG